MRQWQRLQNWLEKALTLGIIFVLFGPPGFLWKVPNIQEVMEQSNAPVTEMRLRHFGLKFNVEDSKPNGLYL